MNTVSATFVHYTCIIEGFSLFFKSRRVAQVEEAEKGGNFWFESWLFHFN